jgi:hypothetical protein
MSENSVYLTTEDPPYCGGFKAIEVMGFSPEVNGPAPGVYVQFVEGCGYNGRHLTLSEAEQLIAILKRIVAQVKAEYNAPPTTYEIIVGNIGTVHSGHDRAEADAKFDYYVADSKTGLGRSGDESVYLTENGEPIREYQGPADDYN